jgi:hypothetical protein
MKELKLKGDGFILTKNKIIVKRLNIIVYDKNEICIIGKYFKLTSSLYSEPIDSSILTFTKLIICPTHLKFGILLKLIKK